MSKLKVFLIFFITVFSFILISAAATTGIAAYLFYKEKQTIASSEQEMKQLATTLTEACTQISELGNSKERQKRLQKFFIESQAKSLFYRAFLVSSDGKIIAHSDPAEAKELNYNIASDEFKYNLDLILQPLRSKESSQFVSDYYVLDLPIPFSRLEITYLKRYLYPDIDKNGWIATQAVTEKGKKTSVVGVIIGKNKIYSSIAGDIAWMKKIVPWIAASAGGASFFIFLVVLIIAALNGRKKSTISATEAFSIPPQKSAMVVDAITNKKSGKPETIVLYEEIDEETPTDRLVIRDAIPAAKR